MKKTKLLMPILGISAIATAIVPTISSCNDPEEETKGEKVDVKLEAVIDTTHAESQYDTVMLISKSKEAYTNEDYVLDITWDEFNSLGKKVSHSFVSQVVIKDANGKIVCTEKDGSYIQYTQTTFGTIKLTIKKEKIFEGMQIVISVRRSEADAWYQNFSFVSDLIDKKSGNSAYGMASEGITADTSDNLFGYQIKLAELSKMASSQSQDVSKDNELIVYVYNASGMSQRIYPSNPSDIYLNNQNIEHKWIEGDGWYEIHIMLPKPISELLEESDQQVVTGCFDVTGEWLRIVDGSQLCVYTPSLINS